MKIFRKALALARKISPVILRFKAKKSNAGRKNCGLKPYTHIYFAKEDYMLIKTWSTERHTSLREMVHEVVKGYMVQTEVDIAKRISDIENERDLVADELARYMKHFGKLPANRESDQNMALPPVKRSTRKNKTTDRATETPASPPQ